MTTNFLRSRIAIILITLACSQSAFAQTDTRYQYQQRTDGTPLGSNNSRSPLGQPEDRKQPPANPTRTVPFDGGLSLVVLAGAGIAAKKRYDKRKAKAQI